MDDDKLNNRVYSPVYTPVAQQNDIFSFINVLDNENTGAFENARSLVENPVFFSPDQSSTPSPWRQMHGNYQKNSYAPLDTGNNTMLDLNQTSSFQYLTNTGNVPNPYQQNYPVFQRENRVNADDKFMNVQPQFSNFHNPGLYRNSSLNRGNAREVIDLTLDDDNGAGGNNPYGTGGGKNVLYKSLNTEVTSSFNQNQINTAQFGNSRRVDDGYLSLGNGYRLTDVLNPDSQNRWMDKLAARSSTSPDPHFGGFPGFRNNMSGLPSSQNNMGGLASSQNNMGGLPSSLNNMGGLPSSQSNMGGLPSSLNNMGGLASSQYNMGGLPSSQNNMGGLTCSLNNMCGSPSSQNNMCGLPSSLNNMGGLPSSLNNMCGLPSSLNNMGGLPSSLNNMGGLPSSQNNMCGLPSSQNNMCGLPSSLNNMGGLPSSQNNMGGLPSSMNNMGGLPSSMNNMGGLPSSQNNMGGLASSQNNMGRLPSSLNNMGGLPSFQNNMGGLVNSQKNMGRLPCSQNNTGGLSNFQNNIVGLPNSQNNLGGLPNSQNNMGLLPNSQINLGVFPSVRNKVGGLNNSVNDAGTMSNDGYLRNTRTSHDVQRPQVNREHGFPKPSNSNLGYMPNVDTRSANLDPHNVLRDRLHAPSGIFSNTPTEFSRSGTYLTTDPSPAQKLHQESLENNLARSLSSARHMGSSFGRDYSGQVPNPRNNEAQAGNDASRFLMRRSNQLTGQMIPSPENYGHLQVPNPHGNPSLKRSIIYPGPSSHRVQRRRTMSQYPSPPYVSFRPQTPPPSSVHIPVSRGSSGGALKPSGHKCMICKRDLAFSPEGPIQQPSIPPGVAVLPCQHTFHDHCLQLITPEDQKTNPPCIPCAIGEK